WEGAVLVPLDDRPRSAHDEPLHAQPRRPLHLEPRRFDTLGAHELLLRVPDSKPVDGDRAIHPSRHTRGEGLVDPKIGFASTVEPSRHWNEAIPCREVQIVEPEMELTRCRRWTEHARHRECSAAGNGGLDRSEEHTSELQSPCNLVCRLLLEKKK